MPRDTNNVMAQAAVPTQGQAGPGMGLLKKPLGMTECPHCHGGCREAVPASDPRGPAAPNTSLLCLLGLLPLLPSFPFQAPSYAWTFSNPKNPSM